VHEEVRLVKVGKVPGGQVGGNTDVKAVVTPARMQNPSNRGTGTGTPGTEVPTHSGVPRTVRATWEVLLGY
jgi:hypothetical protein